MAVTDIIHICGDICPSRKGVAFIGGSSDDYIQVDAAAAGQLAAAYTSGTWAAWIILKDKTQTGTIIGMGDKDVVEFIELNVEAGKLVARCTDATVAAWVLTTDAVVIQPHTWYHVALVHDATRAYLYVNGEMPAQTFSTTTAKTKWIADCTGLDSGRIGAANKAGNDSVTQELGGTVSDLRLYGGTTTTGALTATDIMDLYKYNKAPATTYLYNHWVFDGDYTDLGTGNDTGTSVGDNVLCCGACEFDSRFRAAGLVTADYPVVTIADRRADCWVIKAA